MMRRESGRGGPARSGKAMVVSGSGLRPVVSPALHETDELTGEYDGEQGIADAFKRNVGEGEEQDDDVADEIGPADVPAREVGYAHGQGVVAARGSLGADAQAHAHAYEKCSGDGGQKRQIRDARPERRKGFEEGVEEGEAAPCDDGIEHEVSAHEHPSEQIAEGVHDETRPCGGYLEPVLEQQGGAEYAALGHAGEGVDVVEAEGQNGAAGEIEKAQSWGNAGKHGVLL